MLLSNSPDRIARVTDKIVAFSGIAPDDYDHMLTSGEASWAYVRAHHAGQKVCTLWDQEKLTAIDEDTTPRVYSVEEADFLYGAHTPDGIGPDHYDGVLDRALARDLTFVCSNPDRVVGIAGRIELCPGTFAERYEQKGGRVIWIGKPHRPIYDQAWDTLGKPDKSRILAIGDSLATDVAGALGFGCDVLWNVTGLHWDELKADHAADAIDPEKTVRALQNRPVPTGLLHGFRI